MKELYPKSPAFWLKDAVSYFATVLDVENVSTGDPFAGEPLTHLRKDVKKVLAGLYEDIGEANREEGFQNALANLAHSMSRGKQIMDALCFVLWLLLLKWP